MIFLELFYVFFCIGAFTFGGGYAMLPLMQEQVLARAWATEEELIHFIAVSESTPGPFAVNMATYVGSTQGGIIGAFFATLGVVLPSFIIILIVARLYEQFKNSKVVSAAMSGLKPAAVGLIASAVITMGKSVFFHDGVSLDVFTNVKFYVSAVIFALMSYLLHKKVHPIVVISISAILGIIAGYIIN